MQLHITNTNATDGPRSLNPKGCRVTQLGSPHPLGLTNTGQAGGDQSWPKQNSRHVWYGLLRSRAQRSEKVEHQHNSPHGQPCQCHQHRQRLRERERVNGQRRQNGWEDKFTNHADHVSGVTYSHFSILIMCRYLARPSSRETRQLILVKSQRRLTCLEGPQYKKSRGCAKWQPQIRPLAVKGQDRFGRCLSCSHNAQTDRTQLPGNGNWHRLR